MKLNMDCVRAVMLCAEEYTDYNHYCYFISYQKNNVNNFLLDDPETPPAYQLELEKTYDNDDLFYAVEYCVKSGFVETLFSKDTYRIPISRITPDGHRFLENIRSDTNWEKVKSVAKKGRLFQHRCDNRDRKERSCGSGQTFFNQHLTSLPTSAFSNSVWIAASLYQICFSLIPVFTISFAMVLTAYSRGLIMPLSISILIFTLSSFA